jgi:hypothetical protein
MTRPTSIRYGLLLLCISGNLLISQAQILVPREPSPGGSVSQTVGISTISVLYSRPSVKGREIWGKLVPYGWNVQPFGKGNSAPWRAGANENSVLHLSHDATVEGTPVPAGDYGLFFVINADNSGEVVLSKDYASWGSFFYDPTRDQMRAKIKVRDLNNFTERLTYEFDSVSKNMAELDLNWEKKQFPVKIEFAVDSIFKNYALEVLNGQPGFFWENNFNAANYALTNKVYVDQGIKWADRAISQTPVMAPSITKAGLLDLAGNHAEAEKALQAAMKNATENDLNNYGYQLLGEKKYDKAIAVLKLNTEKHPESANAWDSLGEAYALSGDKKNAIANFKKSLSMNPPAPVKANSEKYLKQLGAM